MKWFRVLVIAIGLVVSACTGNEVASSDSTTTSTSVAESTTTEAVSDIAYGLSRGSIVSAGIERGYQLIVPDSYEESAAMPLVMVFHGYTMTAVEQLAATGFNDLAQQEGFIAVFPEGRGDIQRWLFELDQETVDISPANPDIAMIADLLQHLSMNLNIDEDRVFAAGFSNGGWVASAIGCTMQDRFAAVAPVAGIIDFGDQCSPSGRTPMVTFHGRADTYEPFEGGVENAPDRNALPTDAGIPYGELSLNQNPILEPGVPEKVATWVEQGQCESEPTSASSENGVVEWVYDCDDPVVFYEAERGAHWWDLEIDLDTSQKLWDFFIDVTS